MHKHMLTDPEQIKAFTRAGRATFTLVAKKTGRRFTFKVTRPKGAKWDENKGLIVKFMTGADNCKDFTTIGRVTPEGEFQVEDTHRPEDRKIRAFHWFWRQSETMNTEKLDQCELWHEGRCGRCGKKLTVPESISTGLGPICEPKMHGMNHPGVPTHT